MNTHTVPCADGAHHKSNSVKAPCCRFQSRPSWRRRRRTIRRFEYLLKRTSFERLPSRVSPRSVRHRYADEGAFFLYCTVLYCEIPGRTNQNRRTIPGGTDKRMMRKKLPIHLWAHTGRPTSVSDTCVTPSPSPFFLSSLESKLYLFQAV